MFEYRLLKTAQEELHELYCSRNTNRKSNPEWDGQSIWHVYVKKNVYRILVWKIKYRGQLGRCSSRWEDNIKMDPKETGYKTPKKYIHSFLCLNLSLFQVHNLSQWPVSTQITAEKQGNTKHFLIHCLSSAGQQRFWMTFSISVINNHAS